MGLWTDRIRRAADAMLGADPSLTTVDKALPPGAIPAGSLATMADRMSGRDPALGLVAEPAMGDPVEPGPRPLATERPDGAAQMTPQRWQFPYAYNQTWTPRRYSPTPFQILRNLADVADIIRICIDTRKEQIGSLDFDIVPRDKKTSNADRKGIEIAKAAFARPDKRRPFRTWVSTVIEEVLVIDALSIYRRKTRKGEHYAWEVKDGSTFLCLLDETGDTPAPPEIAYRQIIYGRPVKGGDCTIDELYYRPRCVRTHTPYGLSPVEAVLLTINALLNREMFDLRYFTDGNVPNAIMEAPKEWNQQQIKDFQEYLDAYMSGDLSAKRRLKVVASGMAANIHQFAEPDFQGKQLEWLVKVVCAAFAVPPQEIGFTSDVNRATAGHQENVTYRRGVKPLTGFLTDLFNEMLEFDLGMPELQAVFSGGESEDALKEAQTDKVLIDAGVMTIDEARLQRGDEPFGGVAARPFLMTTLGPVFLDDLESNPIVHPNQRDQPERPQPDTSPTKGGEPPDDKPPAADTSDADLEKVVELHPAPISDEANEDLRRWRVVAVNCVRKGQPIRAFVTDHVPVYLQGQINRVLKYAASVSAVHRAFDLAIDEYLVLKGSPQFSRDERAMQKKVKALVQQSFKKLGVDLVDHLHDDGHAHTQKAGTPIETLEG